LSDYPSSSESDGAQRLLETRRLTKRFGGLIAVDSLDLTLRGGEIRGLIGPNGSGKTTTVNLLSGLYRADAGEIRLRGERMERLPPHEITARGVARTFQISKLFGNMTVLENALVPALAARDRGAAGPMSEIVDRARRLLDFVTLDHLRHAPAKQLSGGQGMLLQIARALMVRPLYLALMDEPFAGVHPTIRDIIIGAIVRMNREESVTFLIVSHEMAELRRLCSLVSVMHEGRLIAEGPLTEVASNALVLEAYLGR
jgi:branched-chain amino acid transport system ATP-binding protein